MLDALTNLQAWLKDSTLLATKGYLAGEWCDGESGQTFPVYNPARGDAVADVSDISRTQAAEAISIAEKAQKLWAARPAKERSHLLREANKEERKLNLKVRHVQKFDLLSSGCLLKFCLPDKALKLYVYIFYEAHEPPGHSSITSFLFFFNVTQ